MENKSDPIHGDPFLDSGEESETLLPGQMLASKFWERFKQLGLYNSLLRAATLIATVLVMLLVVWIFKRYYISADGSMVTSCRSPPTQPSPIRSTRFRVRHFFPICPQHPTLP